MASMITHKNKKGTAMSKTHKYKGYEIVGRYLHYKIYDTNGDNITQTQKWSGTTWAINTLQDAKETIELHLIAQAKNKKGQNNG